MRRLSRWLVAVALVAALTSCRRRPPAGTCNDHLDCDPGSDCVEGRCRKRPPVEGTPAGVEPAVAVPEDDAGAPTPTPPPLRAPSPPRPDAAPVTPPLRLDPPPPGEHEPLWKVRRKNA